MPYMVTFTINIPPMLAIYTSTMDPMGIILQVKGISVWFTQEGRQGRKRSTRVCSSGWAGAGNSTRLFRFVGSPGMQPDFDGLKQVDTDSKKGPNMFGSRWARMGRHFKIWQNGMVNFVVQGQLPRRGPGLQEVPVEAWRSLEEYNSLLNTVVYLANQCKQWNFKQTFNHHM